MIHLRFYRLLTVGLFVVFVSDRLVPQPVSAQTPAHMTKADVESLLKEVSNWGRWGQDDQLGALNLITPAKRKAAALMVKDGISVSLARTVEKESASDNPDPFQHTMLSYGKGTDAQWASDNFSVNYHGYAHTHMDSLCHLFHNDRLYNGFSRDVVTEQGALKLGIQNVKSGILTRGILIDIPRLRGKEYLEPGTPIYPDELDAWENRIGVPIQPGDVVFLRTGRWARRAKQGAWGAEQQGSAGMHASCVRWLRKRDVAMIGSDAASDVLPSGIPGVSHPVHLLVLHGMGVHIFDNCDLEELAKTAAQLNRWEFLLTASPLAVEGGTGSPLNPIATF
ncbi:MAG: cyclase [Planctomycetaceae bacterium]|nr:cyclase [Planctomycetaceae bacterium]